MARRAFKKMKKTVAILTVTSMLMGITITVMPSMNASAMEVAAQNKRNVM